MDSIVALCKSLRENSSIPSVAGVLRSSCWIEPVCLAKDIVGGPDKLGSERWLLKALSISRRMVVLSKAVNNWSVCLAIWLLLPSFQLAWMIRMIPAFASCAIWLKGCVAGGIQRMTPAVKKCIKTKLKDNWFLNWTIGKREILKAASTATSRDCGTEYWPGPVEPSWARIANLCSRNGRWMKMRLLSYVNRRIVACSKNFLAESSSRGDRDSNG